MSSNTGSGSSADPKKTDKDPSISSSKNEYQPGSPTAPTRNVIPDITSMGIANAGLSKIPIEDPFEKKHELRPMPIAHYDDTNLFEFIEFFDLDDQIKELSTQMVERKAVNREWLFRNDETCINVAMGISDAIYGNGILIETENEDVSNLLEYFLLNLNGVEHRHKRYSTKDAIRDGVFSNMMHGESLFVKKLVGSNTRIGVFPIDVKTTTPVIHDYAGWRKYVQYAYVAADLPGVENEKLVDTTLQLKKAKEEFMSNRYEPANRTFMHDRRVLDKFKPVKFHIPEDHMYIVNLYKYPLVDALLEVILNKKYMLYFMRKATEKYAGPMLIVKVGTETAHPQDKDTYETILDQAAIQAAAARFGDALAIPFNWKIESIDISARTFNLIEIVEWTNKTIIQGLGSSMDFFQSFGNTLGMTSVIHDVFIRRINTQRSKFQDVFHDMCKDYLKSTDDEFRKIYPAGISKEEFEVQWAPLKEDDRDRLIASIVQLLTSNVLKDSNEARKLIREAGIYDLKDLTTAKTDELTDKQDPSRSGRKYRYDERPRIRPQMTRFEEINEEISELTNIFNEIFGETKDEQNKNS